VAVERYYEAVHIDIFRYFPPSKLAEEWDDRNRIYFLESNLNFSADHPGKKGLLLGLDICYKFWTASFVLIVKAASVIKSCPILRSLALSSSYIEI
jgi:hypothetical protein